MKKRKKWNGEGIFAFLFLIFLGGFSVCNWYLYGSTVAGKVCEEGKMLQEGRTDAKGAVLALENEVNEKLLLRYPMVEAYGLFQMAMGKQEENGFDVVKDKNGFLHSGNFWSGFGEDQKELAMRVCRLFESLEKTGTKTGFILWPMKLAEPESRYEGIPYNDFTKLSDSMAAWLRYYGVPFLDLRDLKEETGMSQEEFFFKTDHHWTPQAAFEGYLRLMDWMKTEYGEELDSAGELHKKENYYRETHENVMLGSLGQDAGILFAGGLEDYTVVYPKEEGEYLLKTGELGEYMTKEGSFRDALLEMDLEPESYPELYRQKASETYLGTSVETYISIENQGKASEKSILLLRDSYSQPVGAFLAQSFRRVDMLWTLAVSQEELEEFLAENHYDYVLIALYPENLSSDAFPFGMEEE